MSTIVQDFQKKIDTIKQSINKMVTQTKTEITKNKSNYILVEANLKLLINDVKMQVIKYFDNIILKLKEEYLKNNSTLKIIDKKITELQNKTNLVSTDLDLNYYNIINFVKIKNHSKFLAPQFVLLNNFETQLSEIKKDFEGYKDETQNSHNYKKIYDNALLELKAGERKGSNDKDFYYSTIKSENIKPKKSSKEYNIDSIINFENKSLDFNKNKKKKKIKLKINKVLFNKNGK